MNTTPPAFVEAMQRAHQLLSACASDIGESVSGMMKFYSSSCLEALDKFSKTAMTEDVASLVKMCADGADVEALLVEGFGPASARVAPHHARLSTRVSDA